MSDIGPKDVQFYSSKEKELKHSQVHKAHKFIEFNCIQYDKEAKNFECRPIEGYNKTTYKMVRADNEFGFECDCQGFQTRVRKGEPPGCSHVLALHYYFDLRNKARGWGRYKEG